MKIALCFYGQPRFVDKCAPDILNNIINQYNVDVFAHLWFDEKLQKEPYKYGGDGGWEKQRIDPKAIDKFCDIYNPIKLIVEPSKEFKDNTTNFDPCLQKYFNGGDKTEPDFRDRMINNFISYFYSLNESNNLKRVYEYANNFKYDYVIKCRTDLNIKTKIKFQQYDKDKIYYSTINNQPDGMVCDWINFGGSYVMDVFNSVYPVFNQIVAKCKKENNDAWCNELLHRKMLDLFGIESKGIFIDIGLPRF